MRSRILRLALAFAALAVLAGGCLSPTLPLPPPEPNSVTASAAGLWTVAGTCNVGGDTMLVTNESQKPTQQGVSGLCDPDTRLYVIELAATKCDQGSVSEIREGQVTESAGFVFEPTANGFADNSCEHQP